jgi:hypothetical protein
VNGGSLTDFEVLPRAPIGKAFVVGNMAASIIPHGGMDALNRRAVTGPAAIYIDHFFIDVVLAFRESRSSDSVRLAV